MFKAEILADSINTFGDRITTMKITFPRIVLAEFNTHRVFSRNSASSRAIPFNKMVKMVEENPFIPIAWQKEHKGMQGTEYLTGINAIQNDSAWLRARDSAVEQAKELDELEVTKQLCNRLLEPFMWHTVIVTATEWENFFSLRCPKYSIYTDPETEVTGRSWKTILKEQYTGDFKDCDTLYKLQSNNSQAEIHIQAIAELMYDAYNESAPKYLKIGEWHIPYGDNMDLLKIADLNTLEGNYVTVQETQLKVATARCARISYETLGDNPKIDYAADIALHDNLAKMQHWSPFEHCAKAVAVEGGSSRNFRGFVQYRSLVD